MEWGTAVGVVVLDDQVLHFLGIDEGSSKGVLLGLNVVVVLEAVFSKHLFHFLVWAGGDFVYHRPREGNSRLIFQVVDEAGWHQSFAYPSLSIGENTGFHFVAIVRAVVHALNGEWQLACLIALIKQGADLTHGKDGLQASCEVGLIVAIAFLCNGERNHLQRGIAENVYQTLPVGELIVCLQGLCDRCDDFLLDGSRRLQAYQ